MPWTLRTAMRPSDPPSVLDEALHTARFGTMVTRDGRAELNHNRPIHQAIDLHRLVQLNAVISLARATNAEVVVESAGDLTEDGNGRYTITVTIGG